MQEIIVKYIYLIISVIIMYKVSDFAYYKVKNQI